MLHYRTCNLCEAMCGLEIEYEGRQVTSIRGDKNDPFSRGHICPKAVALKDIFEDPDRLKRPLRRTAAGWMEISWEEAITEAAKGLRKVQEQHGQNAVGVYLGNPNVHNMGSAIFGTPLSKALGSKNRFSATSVDQLPHHIAAHYMFGHPLLVPVPDLDRTNFLIIMGGNPLVSNGSMMTAPDVAKRLKSIQQRGGKIIVIDPRRSETAAKADQHLFIQPGMDAWLLLSMLHCLFDEQLLKVGPLEPLSKGLDVVREAVQPFAPETVAHQLGIPAGQIRQLTREFAASDRAACYGRMGLSTQAFGGLCQWAINLINFLTGNLDSEGGTMFTQPAFDLVMQRTKKGKERFNRYQSRVRGLPEFTGEFPVSTLIDEINTPGEGQIKGMLTIAGNPVLSTPGGQHLDKAFSGMEFMVAIDIYLNETTRHADIILPPTTGLESAHYDLIFHVLAIRNTTKYSPVLFEKEEGQKHDWEIFQELTAALLGQKAEPVPAEQFLAMGLMMGPYASSGLSLEKIKDNPHGIDLGPLKPCLADRLLTGDGLIDLAPTLFLEDLTRLQSGENRTNESFPMTLIGRRHLRSCNSWMHNSQRLVKGGNRCTVLMHPQDAEKVGVENGTQVEVSSRVGSVRLPAELSDEMMPGVLSIPHGWGHDHEDIRQSIAQAHPGVSINDLTDPMFLDELTGNAALSGVPVKVVPV